MSKGWLPLKGDLAAGGSAYGMTPLERSCEPLKSDNYYIKQSIIKQILFQTGKRLKG
jgi:hypothetical protein